MLADILEHGQRVLLAKGGEGGHGNARFVNSVRQSPRFAELGEPGEACWLRFSLKLIADAGLAGLPNAGKSSLLRRLSNAKPKVADYPFTTLEPMLGVVDWSGEGDVFALADVPGCWRGRATASGSGTSSLPTWNAAACCCTWSTPPVTTRPNPCRVSARSFTSWARMRVPWHEKPQVVVINKIDALPPTAVEELTALFIEEVERLRRAEHPAFTYLVGEDEPLAKQLVWPVSAATGAGLTALLHWVGPLLRELAPPEQAESAEREWQPGRGDVAVSREAGGHVTYRPRAGSRRGFVVGRNEYGWTVYGEAVRRLIGRFDLDNDEAVRYLNERLDRLGVYSALRGQGAKQGDDVDIEGYEFEFQ